MAPACTSCSAKLRAGARFCWRCGTAISQVTSTSAGASRAEGERPATRSSSTARPPATVPEEAIVGAMPPLAAHVEKGVAPASPRKATSIIAAGATLRPGVAEVFTSDRSEVRTRNEERAQDPLPWLKLQEPSPEVDAGGEVPQAPANSPPTVELPPARIDDAQWPAHTGAVESAAALQTCAVQAARGFRLDWKVAAAVVLAALVGGYAMLRSGSPVESGAEASSQPTGAALAAVAPAGTDSAAGGPALPSTAAAGAADGQGLAPAAASPAPPAARPPVVSGDHSPPSRGATAEKGGSKPTARAGSRTRNRAAAAAAPAVAPLPSEEVAVVQVAPPQPAPAPPPPPGPCDGLRGLKQQQCLSCGTLGPLRTFDCELRVRDAYCQGKWGTSPSCVRDAAVEHAGGG